MDNLNMEYTYVMIKPDISWNEVWVEQIKNLFRNNGIEIVATYESECNPSGFLFLNIEQLEQHYGHVKKYGDDVYESLIAFMRKGPVIPMVLRGENAVSAVRELVGPTDSKLAPRNTIRGLYGTDKKENAIHASDSVKSAIDEIVRFFGMRTLKDIEEKSFQKTYNFSKKNRKIMYF